MNARICRTIAATLLAGTVTAVGLLTAVTPAQAQAVTNGTFTMAGDPGDYITGGGSYSYDTAAGDTLNISASADLRSISMSIDGTNGDWWYLDLKAPAGQQLVPGEYPNATRAPFSGDGAGLSVDGNGRGCNELTGSFVVAAAAYGTNGEVEQLDATFEQHCEGGTAALRGRVVIGTPAPPADKLQISATPAADGLFSKLNGKATVHGTVECNQDATVTVAGLVTQVKNKVLIRGPFTTAVACVKGQATEWSATADPTGTTPFQKGKAELTGSASANDPNYAGSTVTITLPTTTVTLTRAPATIEALI